MRRLYDLFLGVDASQVEINPFAETKDGRGTAPEGVLRALCGSALAFPLLLPPILWPTSAHPLRARLCSTARLTPLLHCSRVL